MDRTLRALGLGDFFCDVVTAIAPRRTHQTEQGHQRSDSARKQREGRRKVLPSTWSTSQYSARTGAPKKTRENCIEFGKESGAKINSAKSETLLLGHWTPTRDPVPFPIKQDFLKILGVWVGREDAAEKSWEERLVKTNEKRGPWSLRKLTIKGKSLVLRNETLPVLQYVAQVWPVQPRTAKAITRMIFYFTWNSKMDRVKREEMFKTHDKGGQGVPDIATILRGTFVCHCVRNTLRSEDESRFGFLMARFFLLSTWR
ncbi:hypothetical protein NDU88_005767 [Pleurodeles waltl]|uniref:Reverse transcriptase n=1 Tax=Pleurodeles waltl TaxID=8319 RepID=A0AAV7NPW8_PLEWA|nr:hypothetical protein NDU88_005767 [Pleurodeles waltl]